MSKLVPGVAIAEKRVVRFLIWPSAIGFATGAWVAVLDSAWWAATVFVLLVALMGWQTSRIVMSERPDDESEEATSQRERYLADVIGRVYFVFVAGVSLFAVVTGIRYYWAIAIGVAMFILAPLARAFVTSAVYR